MIKETYYWMYKALQKIRRDENPAFDAFFGVSFIIGLNIITMIRVVYNTIHFKVSRDAVIPYAIVGALILIILNYFYLYKRRCQIFDSINRYPKKRLKIGKMFFISYVIISFLGFYALGLL